jgi:hypothetical protein
MGFKTFLFIGAIIIVNMRSEIWDDHNIMERMLRLGYF